MILSLKNLKSKLMKIVTISGISGSGKTKLANKLNTLLENSLLISLDNYSYDEQYLQNKYNIIDYSSPFAFNQELFHQNILLLQKNDCVNIPILDIKTKIKTNTRIQKPNVLIIEGMFAQSFTEIFNTLNVYMDIDLDIALIRKIKRDPIERNRNIQYILEEHLNNTRKNIKFVQKQKKKSDIIYDNNQSEDTLILNNIVKCLNE